MAARKKQIRAKFREIVFKRDGHKCVMCGSTEDLAAHHIIDRNKIANGGYVLENGITLCPPCHVRAEQWHISLGKEYEDGWHPWDLFAKLGLHFSEAYDAARASDPTSRFSKLPD